MSQQAPQPESARARLTQCRAVMRHHDSMPSRRLASPVFSAPPCWTVSNLLHLLVLAATWIGVGDSSGPDLRRPRSMCTQLSSARLPCRGNICQHPCSPLSNQRIGRRAPSAFCFGRMGLASLSLVRHVGKYDGVMVCVSHVGIESLRAFELQLIVR